MRKYKQIEYKAGATLEIIKCIPYGLRKGHPREKAEKKTKEGGQCAAGGKEAGPEDKCQL